MLSLAKSCYPKRAPMCLWTRNTKYYSTISSSVILQGITQEETMKIDTLRLLVQACTEWLTHFLIVKMHKIYREANKVPYQLATQATKHIKFPQSSYPLPKDLETICKTEDAYGVTSSPRIKLYLYVLFYFNMISPFLVFKKKAQGIISLKHQCFKNKF